MLDILRRSASGVVGIFLIGLLVIAFALWGIADTFTGFSNATLASVGMNQLSAMNIACACNSKSSKSRSKSANRFRSVRRAAGIDRRVLTDMLGMAALSGMAKNMGLAHSDEQVARQIINDPAFCGRRAV